MTRRRSRLALLALPIAPFQGIWLTRTMVRYADADGRAGTVGSGPGRLMVVALGDSVTAGYAVPHHRASVAGQLAARLAARATMPRSHGGCARRAGPRHTTPWTWSTWRHSPTRT
ncbi:hypothetical protein [Nostocoides veronense]|uniref:hypothetical protein n=1 Tax=Nostocoides veronense TaxID=330836 RepID=UPI0031E1F360